MPLNNNLLLKQKRNQLQKINYKSLVRNRFKAQVSLIIEKYKLEELVLVLDIFTSLLISDLFKIYELVQMKIIYLERLEKKRKRMPQLHAIYFMLPTLKNIQNLKGDFPQKGLTQQKSKKQYKRIHILFTSFTSHSTLKQIALHKPLFKRIATNSIKQFYHSSRFLSDSVVDFGVEGYGSKAYSKQSVQQNQKRIRIAQRIMEFVVNLGQVNNIRLLFKRSANGIAQRVSQIAQKMINKYLGSLIQNKSYNISSKADDITFLIFDRSIDPVTPLLHSFTSQALLFDLLKVAFEGTQKQQSKQYFQFRQFNDSIYQTYRYEHLSTPLEELPKQFNKQNQKLMSLQKPKNVNSPTSTSTKPDQNQIDITEFNQKITVLRKHIQMLKILFQELKNKDLFNIGELEMSLATGITDQGKNTSSSKLYDSVLEIVEKKDSNLSKEQKLRLGLIVLCCIKLSKKDYQKLLDKYNDEQDKMALKNILALGVSYDKSISKSTKGIQKYQQNRALQRMQRTKLPSDRYSCVLQQAVPATIQILQQKNPQMKKIDKSIFGQLNCFGIQGQKLNIIKFNKERLILIMVGGISFAEISSIRRNEELKGIIIGADEVISPNKYLKMLKNIDILS